jgi:hypothetical protein
MEAGEKGGRPGLSARAGVQRGPHRWQKARSGGAAADPAPCARALTSQRCAPTPRPRARRGPTGWGCRRARRRCSGSPVAQRGRGRWGGGARAPRARAAAARGAPAGPPRTSTPLSRAQASAVGCCCCACVCCCVSAARGGASATRRRGVAARRRCGAAAGAARAGGFARSAIAVRAVPQVEGGGERAGEGARGGGAWEQGPGGGVGVFDWGVEPQWPGARGGGGGGAPESGAAALAPARARAHAPDPATPPRPTPAIRNVRPPPKTHA